MSFSSEKKTLEFREIVMTHLERILKISSEEFREKKIVTAVAGGSATLTVDQENTHKSYRQAVEALAIVLHPYFDEKAKEVYSDTIEDMNSWNFQLAEKHKEELEKVAKGTGNEVKVAHSFYFPEKRMAAAKKLFRELNLLLKRNDYLKSNILGDANDETTEED